MEAMIEGCKLPSEHSLCKEGRDNFGRKVIIKWLLASSISLLFIASWNRSNIKEGFVILNNFVN